ncbi:M56 family metallopeptidase [Polaribacter porphyrae]|uniref:BlaR1 peptidase M56 n=1 Tax=Polaribacter porphyrae TaxID=1137780 RepID=A0A2S7WP19_9FLAO|nr:M56 family metallopeptidase [Polaribacter porphyrae]PQJ79334.1 BlaR1 peptidase M56 [Polaribacter porphyrae]
MINYILQVILYQVLFLMIYDFFLSKETFFTKNRWYLLLTPILSFIIPLIKIPTFQKAVSQDFIIQLPEIVLSPEKVIQNSFEPQNIETSVNYINILFWLGVVVFLILFLVKLIKIINLIRSNEIIRKSDFKLILIPKQRKAFSFFNYIFLGKEIKDNQKEKVIQHELVHSKQKHTLDLLFFEILKIVMWFNPMLYFYQKRITLVHEYISDAEVAKLASKEQYINNLLSNFFQVENIGFVNQFYKSSFVKRRVLMITKKQSKQINQFKYLLLIPVLVFMFFYSSCSSSKSQFEKRTITHYRIADGKLFSYKGDKETYFDSYFGVDPKGLLEEIPFDELPEEIKEQEYAKFRSFRKKFNGNLSFSNMLKFDKFFKTPDGRIARGSIGNNFTSIHPDKLGDELLFIRLSKRPTFPGCEEGDSECFLEKLDQHFFNNFDKTILTDLELDTKKVKVLVDFNINTNGFVEDIDVKAPNKIIGEEAIKVIAALPKMTGGEKYGKPIKANYKLPFTILIE